MSEIYGVDVKLPLDIVSQWHIEKPPEPWEVERAKRLAQETGLQNNWILGTEQ